MNDYDAACEQAIDNQGLRLLVDALRRHGIEHEVKQTGGFVMVVHVPVEDKDQVWTITNDGDSKVDRFLMIRWDRAALERGDDEPEPTLQNGTTLDVMSLLTPWNPNPATYVVTQVEHKDCADCDICARVAATYARAMGSREANHGDGTHFAGVKRLTKVVVL